MKSSTKIKQAIRCEQNKLRKQIFAEIEKLAIANNIKDLWLMDNGCLYCPYPKDKAQKDKKRIEKLWHDFTKYCFTFDAWSWNSTYGWRGKITS